MGLMLSILIVCVGVIEVLSCYEHFQYGVIHCATNAYENARRNSLFLTYTSRRLKLLSEDAVTEDDERPQRFTNFKQESTSGLLRHKLLESDHLNSVIKPEAIKSSTNRVKRLDKEDKIHIVKTLLEKPRRPKTVRSISMPELIQTPRDIELTKIIDYLAVEPIEEINIEVEDSNTEVLTKEFDKLFDEYENSQGLPSGKSERSLHDFIQTDCSGELEAEESKVVDVCNQPGNFQKDPESYVENKIETQEYFTKAPKKNPLEAVEKDSLQTAENRSRIGRSASLDLDKVPHIKINKSLSENLDMSSYFNKKRKVSFKSDELPISEESILHDKLDVLSFEDVTPFVEVIDQSFEEIYNDIYDDSVDVASSFEELENDLLSVKASGNVNLKMDSSEDKRRGPLDSMNEKGLKNHVVLKIEKLAELLVKDSLNLNKIKNLIFQELTNSNENLGFETLDIQGHIKNKKTVAEKHLKSKCNALNDVKNKNICTVKEMPEVKSETKNDVSEEVAIDECRTEKQTKEENDLMMSRCVVDEGEVEEIDFSALEMENSNLSDDSAVEVSSVEFNCVGPENEIVELPVYTKGAEMVIDKDLEEGIRIETPKDLLHAESTKETFARKANENCPESSFEVKEAHPETKIKCSEKEQESVKLIEEAEIQSEKGSIIIQADSDLPSETAKTPEFEGKTLLALEYKEEIKSEDNKKGIIPFEPKGDQDIDNKNSEKVQPVHVIESVIKAKEPLLKAEGAEEKVEFERIDAVLGNLGEAKELLNSEKAKENREDDLENLTKSDSGEEVETPNSAPEAFWLIFSGEYTKAMSKDWHSGHFSCWQCDEALTGQRYVLRDDHPYCIKCYESVFANVCEECNKIIGIDSKDLSYKDKHWHEACFLCNKCRVSLVDKQFGSKADKIYCGNCYDTQFASRCDGCGEIFRAGTKKMEYKTRQWHEKCFCCCVCKTPIGTKSFIPREQEIYCATCYEEKFATRCVKCNKIITSGGVTYKNEPWHRECFTCTNCNTSLAGQRFTSRDEKPYCADCFGELFAKRCTACSRPITGIGGTRFISFEDRHWHNDCFICASCKTSLVGRGFITDGDDIICPECAKQKLM